MDTDFNEVVAWLEYSRSELDRANRETMDSVALRMQQGAAQALTEFIDRARGEHQTVRAIVNSTPASG